MEKMWGATKRDGCTKKKSSGRVTIGEGNIVKRVESKLVHVHWNAIIKSITFKPNFKNQFLPCVLSPSPNMFASAEKNKESKGEDHLPNRVFGWGCGHW